MNVDIRDNYGKKKRMMKKALSLILALVMCLSLCACGSGNEENDATTNDGLNKNETANYIGVWKSAHMQFTIEKGGVGRYELPGNTNGIGYYDFTWEVKDEILVITIKGQVAEYKATFELNDAGTSLTILHNGLPTSHQDETEYAKK